MDVNTVAPIMGLILMIVALGFITFGFLSILDWYGMINVPWLNVDRKSPPKDVNPRNE